MLHSIGRKARHDDLVDLFLECHVRIRTFSALAVGIGERPDAPAEEVIDGCTRVARYFTEALPLHVRDEEDSVLPRLRGRSTEVDSALDRLRAEHETHLEPLQRLLAAASAVRSAPGTPALHATLLTEARALKAAFESHLLAEEGVIFPAIRALLPAEEQAAIVSELRARRAR